MSRWVLGIALSFFLLVPLASADNASTGALEEGYHDPLYVNSMVPYLNSSAPGNTEDILTWNGTTLELDNAEVAFEVQPNGTLDVLTSSGDIELQPAGNVSVGVDNPSKAFVVNGSGNFTQTIYKNNSEVATEEYVINNTVLLNKSLNISGPPGTVQFTNGTNLEGDGNFTYNKTTGRLGIGTTQPTDTLTVNGSSRFKKSVNVDPSKNASSIGQAGLPSSIFFPSVEYDGEYAYVGHGQQFSVVDISNEENPQVLSTTSVTDYSTIIDVAGDLAYVPHFGGGMDIIDVSNPADPKSLGTVNTADTSKDVEVLGDKALLLSRDYGGDPDNIVVVDVSDPRNPTRGATWDIFDTTTSFEVKGETAYVSDGGSTRRLYALNLSDLSNMRELHNVTTGNWVEHMELRGGYAYLTGYDKSDNGQLDVVNITDPSNMNVVASKHLGGFAGGFDVSGDYAYFADSGTIDIWDVSDPTNPTQYADVSAGGSTRSLDVIGQRALVGVNDSLQVFDIGGAKVSTLSTGTLQSDDIYARGDVQVANELEVASNIEVGSQGLDSRGPGSFQDSLDVEGDTTVSQRLGVGTTTPDDTLDVNGSGIVRGNFSVSDGNRVVTDGVAARDSDGLKLYNDNGEGIFVEDDGNIGVGSADPNQTFFIAGKPQGGLHDSVFAIEAEVNSSSDGNTGQRTWLDIEPTASVNKDYVANDNLAAAYNANTANAEVIAVRGNSRARDADIGTAIGGQFRIQPWNAGSGGSTINNAYGVQIQNISDLTADDEVGRGAGIAVDAQGQADRNTNVLIGTLDIPDENYSVYSNNSDPSFFAGSINTSSGEDVCIEGEICLSNATTNETLDTAGGDGAVQYAYNNSLAGNTSILFINRSSGDVGVGTADPQSQLEVGSNGTLTFAGSNYRVAIGSNQTIFNGTNQILIGDDVRSGVNGADTSSYQIAIGDGADASVSGVPAGGASDGNIAIGRNARADGKRSVVVGAGSSYQSKDSTGVVIGPGTSGGSGNHVTAVGPNAGASGNEVVTVGTFSSADAESVALGYNADASARGAVAVGESADTSQDYSIALGYGASPDSSNQFVVGGTSERINETIIAPQSGGAPLIYADTTGVGVGTTSPTADLSVNGSVNVSAPSGAESLYVDQSSGNIGVGTDNTSEQLTIAGNNSILFTSTSPQNRTTEIFADDSDSLNVRYQGGAGKSFNIKSGTTTVANFRAESTGHRIYGDLQLQDGLTVDDEQLVVDESSDEVGINTTSPSADLDVAGDAEVTENLDVDGNVSVGDSITDSNGDRRIEMKNDKVVINLG